MNLIYNSKNFSSTLGPDFQGEKTLQFTVPQLMWAAITVGRANFLDVMSQGVYSHYEILYRAAMIVANLGVDTKNDQLIKSSAYKSLDPSEKGAVSYFLSLAMTKLIASRLLDIHWLLHVDVYKNQFRREGRPIAFGSSRSKPDLIGRHANGNWAVFESKGRTHGLTNETLARAKEQTRNLHRIGNRAPTLRIALATYFMKDTLHLVWEDPDEVDKQRFDIETNENEFLRYYYNPIRNILVNNESREIDGFIAYTFDGVDLTVGLDRNIFEAYSSDGLRDFVLPRTELSKVKALAQQDSYVGADGILVGLGKDWHRLLRSKEKAT